MPFVLFVIVEGTSYRCTLSYSRAPRSLPWRYDGRDTADSLEDSLLRILFGCASEVQAQRV